MTRSVAAILCLLYLGVSTILAAVHHHDGSAHDQKCAACSWHHDGTVDEPGLAPRIVPPELIITPDQIQDVTSRDASLRIHPSRGPPAGLL